MVEQLFYTEKVTGSSPVSPTMKTILWLPATIALIVVLLFSFSSAREIIVDTSASVIASKPVTILAFGDMMLDRAVREKIDEKGVEYLFEHIKHLIAGHDIVVANAEGVFSHNESISVRDHSQLVFTFDPSSLPTLKALGFTLLSQANNHALNFGWSSLRESQAAIQAAGIDTFGDPENVSPGPVYVDVRGEKVAFVGYNQFSSDAGFSSSTLAAIREAKKNEAFVVVYPHWGDEYNLGTTSLQTVLAHKFIDAGADVIIGSHPHVVEPLEKYKGRAIFYSLGNFIFDQRWNSDVSHGLAVEISLTKKEIRYKLIPYVIENLQPRETGEVQSFVLKR